MDFKTYAEDKRPLYQRFAEAVAEIVRAAVERSGDLRLQHLQHRAKALDSLARKLERDEILNAPDIEDHVKDLAGARLVFTTNADVTRFLNSGILRDNLEIDWERTKIHHPGPDTAEASELFISHNFVVTLTEARLGLPEYAPFAGLRCEVQVQTALHHAWAEMAHDTIYKRPELKGFGTRQMEQIEKRMEAIMRDHIIPAGHAFQKVALDFERLLAGKTIFDRDPLATIRDCDNNNELYDALADFENYVLPHYDDPRPILEEILDTIAGAVEKARETPATPIQTAFGAMPGYKLDRIAGTADAILDHLLYARVDLTFATLCRLFEGASDDSDRRLWIERFRKLAGHDRDAWCAVGPQIQRAVVDELRALSPERRQALRALIVPALRNVLSPEISGATATHETITLHTGNVVVSNVLRQIRSDAIDLLAGLLDGAPGDVERREIIRALTQASHLPHLSTSPSAELAAMILEDARRVVSLYEAIAPRLSFELLQAIEHDLLWQYHRNGTPVAGDTPDPAVATAREALGAAILAFRDTINNDEEFAIYKTLVGFNSVLPPAWDDQQFGFEQEEAYRRARMEEFVQQVTPQTAERWFIIIKRCARTVSNDGATFPVFAEFLSAVGRTQPAVALSYLQRLDDQLARFLAPLLEGLQDAAEWPEAEAILCQWVEQGRHLASIAWCYRRVSRLDSSLLGDLLAAATKVKDADAVIEVLAAASQLEASSAAGPVKETALAAFTHLCEADDPRLLNAFALPRPARNPFLRGLSREEVRGFLNALVRHPRVEFLLEDLLELFAASWPDLVTAWFGERLRLPVADRPAGYEPVPFDFRGLEKQLSQHPNLVLSEALAFAENESGPAQFGSARLVAITFPGVPDELQSRLIDLAGSGGPAALSFLIQLLHAYDGKPAIYGLAREIAAAVPEADPRLTDALEAALETTGVTSGEFGRVAAFKEKRAEIQTWTDDPRESVRRFAARFLLHLDNRIASEQRRAEEDLAMRKLHYG